MHGIQLFKTVQTVQRLHQLLFGEARRQAQRVEELCFPLRAACRAGKTPIVQVGIGDLPSLRAGGCRIGLRAQCLPQNLDHNGVVHALHAQKPLFAGLGFPLLLAVDGRDISLHHIPRPY